MADKTIIVEINYDTKAAVDNLNTLTDTITANNKQLSALQDSYKKGTITQEQYSQAVAETRETNAKLNAQRKDTIQGLQAEEGSINKLRSEVNRLTKERNSLNLNTADGIKRNKEINKSLDDYNKTIKKNLDVQTKQKMNIGKYPDLLNQMGAGQAGAAQGFLQMAKAAMAFVMNPIGLIIMAIVAAVYLIIEAFKTFDPVVDAIEQGIAALSGAFTALKEGVVGFMTGQKGFKESIEATGKAMKQAALDAIAMKKAEQELDDMTMKATANQAKYNRQINELLLQSKDRTKSEKERQGLIEQALKLEEDAYAEKKAIADKEYEIALSKITIGRSLTAEQIAQIRERGVEAVMELQSTKAISDSEIKTLSEAIAKKENILNESVSIREKAINRQNVLIEKAAAEEEKYVAKLQAIRDKAAAEEEKFQAQEKKWDEEAAARKQKQIDKETELAERKLEAQAELAELNAAAAILEEEDLTKRRDLQLIAEIEDRARKVDNAKLTAEEIAVIDAKSYAKKLKIETDYQAQLKANSKQRINDAMQIAAAASQLTAVITMNQDAETIGMENAKRRELKAAGDNKAAQEAINQRYAKKEADLKRKQAVQNKKRAIIDASIATALAVVSALQSVPPASFAFAAIAAVMGGIQIAAIARQPIPEFAQGGMIGGRSHAQGGTKFFGSDGSMFEAEKGEAMFVLKKDAAAEINALSMLNESHGGRSFRSGSSSHLADGGEVNTSMSGVEKIVDQAIQRTPIFVRVGDIETGMTDFNNVKQAGVI